ncbi:hypothetical protein ACQCN2_08415 [Brevibacillus ginsengisoli]|uniref:hypothetical protein n=1 Tax=Brevibacillus ginsengisoli TaxID=363854 RepID=UPI003CFBB290
MVNLDSSISFLLYITAVSSAAAGVTEAFKSIIPFMGTDYIPEDEDFESHNMAARLTSYKRFLNLVISTISAGVIFALIGIDPGLILIGAQKVYVEHSWEVGVWVWGIVAVFGSPFFHSLLKIMEGLKQSVNDVSFKPRQKVKKP